MLARNAWDHRDAFLRLKSVQDLRDSGVTLHLSLEDTKRTPLADVPAVYLIEPTKANIQIVAEDISNALYASFDVHFLQPISRHLLEDFASLLATNGGSEHLLSGIWDEYIDFIAEEPNLFTLRAPTPKTCSFKSLNQGTSEQDIEAEVERIATALFAVCVTTGIFRCVRI